MITPFNSPETTVLGAVFVFYGYLLKVHGVTTLVAGFDEKSEISKTTAAEMIGEFALLVGVSTISFGYLMSIINPSFGNFGLLYAAVVMFAALGFTYRVNTIADRSSQPTTESTGSRSPEPSD